MSREQSAVQRQSDSSRPEPMREIPPEQRSEVDGRGRHEASVHANRDHRSTSNIQAQSNDRNVSQLNQDPGINIQYMAILDYATVRVCYQKKQQFWDTCRIL